MAESILQYYVIYAETPWDLQSEVNKKIEEGWIPCGGIAKDINFYQAITRLVNKKDLSPIK